MGKQVVSRNQEPVLPARTLPFQRKSRYGAGAGLRMLSRLQTTLDPQRLLQFYFEDAQSLVGLSGLDWQHEGMSVSCGEIGRYRVTYSLSLASQPLGELTVSRRLGLTDPESRLLEQSLGLLIHPLRNAVAYQSALQAARRDPLTGLGNRAALDECLARELDLCRRHQEPFSVILLDVDRFKDINDRHGHPAGDYVLKGLAEILVQSARQSDLLFRYAGDEFLVAMSRTPPSGALAVADRIRSAVETASFRFRDSDLPVRVSLGVASATGAEAPESLFTRADEALLSAKRGGRNQIAVGA